MIYVQHLLGIGHLMRARLLAEAIADRGLEVHLVSGGMPIGGRMPRGVRTVQLPPIRVSDASFTPLRDADFTPIDDAYRERRRALLLAAFAEAAPAAVLFETFPFGRRSLRFELMPLLGHIKVVRQWAGPYDISPDGDPIVGELPDVPGFHVVCGFRGHGFMMAPVVARHFAAFLSGGPKHEFLTAWSPARFAAGAPPRRGGEEMFIG